MQGDCLQNGLADAGVDSAGEQKLTCLNAGPGICAAARKPVSYTHLTLPTILLV